MIRETVLWEGIGRYQGYTIRRTHLGTRQNPINLFTPKTGKRWTCLVPVRLDHTLYEIRLAYFPMDQAWERRMQTAEGLVG